MSLTVDARKVANIPAGEPAVGDPQATSGQLRKRFPWESVAGPLIDLSTGSAAVAIGMTWATHLGYDRPPIWMLWCFAPTIVAMSAMRGLYRRSLQRTFLDELPTIQAVTALAAVLLLSGIVLNTNLPGSADDAVARMWMCAAVLLPLGRLLWFALKRHWFRTDVLTAPTLIVGNGRIAAKVVDRLAITPEYGLRPVGLVDDELPWMGVDRTSPSSIPHLGTLDRLDEVITRTGAECMIVAFSRTRDDALALAVKTAHLRGLAVWIVPRIFDTIGVHARIDHIGGLPLIAAPRTDPRSWQFVVKHVTDRVAALVGLAPTRRVRHRVRARPGFRTGRCRGRGSPHPDRRDHARHLPGRTAPADQRHQG